MTYDLPCDEIFEEYSSQLKKIILKNANVFKEFCDLYESVEDKRALFLISAIQLHRFFKDFECFVSLVCDQDVPSKLPP